MEIINCCREDQFRRVTECYSGSSYATNFWEKSLNIATYAIDLYSVFSMLFLHCVPKMDHQTHGGNFAKS